ncbi:hypothetical protein BGZ72_002406, partial [Mortierella alpina]
MSALACHHALGALLVSDHNPRRWEVLDQVGQASFSVVQYNLLSNSLAQKDVKYRGGQFLPNPHLNADIVLDEPDHSGGFGTAMKRLGYASVFQKRRHGLIHGVAIFWLVERLTLVRDCPVPHPNHVLTAGIDNPGVMLVLEFAKGLKARRICVATAHIRNGEDQELRKLSQVVS